MKAFRSAAIAFIFLSLVGVLPDKSQAQWEQVNCGLADSNISSLALSGANLFAGTYGRGVFHSTNSGVTWSPVNSGLADTMVSALFISGKNLLAGTFTEDGQDGLGGVFLSTDFGKTWAAKGLQNRDINCVLVTSTDMYAGGTREIPAVLHSTNSGTSWTESDAGPEPSSVWAFAVSGENLYAATQMFAGVGGGVYRSTDKGSTWTVSNTGMPYPDRVLAVSVAVHDSVLFVGTFSGGVFRSTDFGTTWTTANVGLPSYVLCFADSGANLFAGTAGAGVYCSTNKGTTWTAINTGLPSNTLVYAFAVGGWYLYAGTFGGGVWRRPLSEVLPIELASFSVEKNGANSIALAWTTMSETNNYGFNVQISSNQKDWANVGDIIPGHGTTMDSQQYRVSLPIPTGAWWVRLVQVDLDGKTTIYDSKYIRMDSPSHYALEQNYPNPFNPSTTIRYALQTKCLVTLVVFNTIGQEVANLVNEEQEAGYHDIQFDGSRFASGVYFYRIRAGGYVETKRFLLLR